MLQRALRRAAVKPLSYQFCFKPFSTHWATRKTFARPSERIPLVVQIALFNKPLDHASDVS
jgi:hypothetical protein